MRHLKVASLALVLLSGCMVGPNYSRPSVPMAPGYKEYPPASFKEDDGWKVIQPSDAQLKGNWWELFGDPQLNTLEARVEGANCPCFSLSQSKGPLHGQGSTVPLFPLFFEATRGNCSVLLLRPRPPVESGRPLLLLPALDRDPDSVPFAEATSLPNGGLGHHGAQLFGRAEAPPPIL
jgi:hypothetical protein